MDPLGTNGSKSTLVTLSVKQLLQLQKRLQKCRQPFVKYCFKKLSKSSKLHVRISNGSREEF